MWISYRNSENWLAIGLGIILMIHKTSHEIIKEERIDMGMNFEDECMQRHY